MKFPTCLFYSYGHGHKLPRAKKIDIFNSLGKVWKNLYVFIKLFLQNKDQLKNFIKAQKLHNISKKLIMYHITDIIISLHISIFQIGITYVSWRIHTFQSGNVFLQRLALI